MAITTNAHGGSITGKLDEVKVKREGKSDMTRKKSAADSSAETYKYSTSAKAITAMHRINQRGMNIEMDVDGQPTGRIEINGIVFTLGCYNTARLNVGAKILADYLLTRFSEIAPFGAGATLESIGKTVSITVTLDDYMSMRGLTDKQSARAQFRETAHALLNVGMQFDYIIHRKKGKKTYEEHAHVDGYMFICNIGFRTNDEEPLQNSRIIFTLNPLLLYYLCNRSIMPIDVRMLAINYRQNPHGFSIIRKLTEYFNENAPKKNAEICISVRSLTEACPELPTIDEIRNEDAGQLSLRIRKPFERDLDALEENYRLVKWRYCKRRGIEFEPEEKQPADYNFHDWLELMIKFTIPDYIPKKSRKPHEQEVQQEDTVKTE